MRITRKSLYSWLFAVVTGTVAFTVPVCRADTAADYARTPEGFYYMMGAMLFQSQTCGFSIPDRLIDRLAEVAGVTKEMVATEGASTVQEGYAAAKEGGEQEGIAIMCDRVRPSFERAQSAY